jgi:hypothetical protein
MPSLGLAPNANLLAAAPASKENLVRLEATLVRQTNVHAEWSRLP